MCGKGGVSAGAVGRLFREQIRCGGPVPVTGGDVTRYFMTIPEACQLIRQAAAIGSQHAVYTLDMGEPVSIRLLAEQQAYTVVLAEKGSVPTVKARGILLNSKAAATDTLNALNHGGACATLAKARPLGATGGATARRAKDAAA